VSHFRLSEFDEKLLDSQLRDSATNELLARHESEIEQRHAAIRRLEAELGRANAELDQVRNELGQATQERRRLAAELSGAQSLVSELEQRPGGTAAENELTRIRLELGQIMEDRSRLTSDLDRTKHLLAESESQAYRAAEELNSAQSELTRVTGSLSDLDRKMSESLLAQQQLTEAKRHSDDLCNFLSTDLDNLKIQFADIVDQLATTKSSNRELENQLLTSVLLCLTIAIQSYM